MDTPLTIVVPDDYPPALTGSTAQPRLERLGNARIHTTRAASEEELAQRMVDAEVAINIRAYSKFTDSLLARCPRLRLISIWGTGVDNVDLAACARLGVTVTNTPGINARAVAEHTLTLMLAVTRRLRFFDQKVRAGKWPREQQVQLLGKTLGVVGLGAIGRRMVELGQALGMQVVAWSYHPDPKRAQKLGVRLVEWEDLFCRSDVVSLHLRLTPESTGLVGRRELGWMKPTAILVNTARGAIVDRAALLEALREGKIGGAGLDVFHEEPLPADDPLLKLDNVLLTPHNSANTHEVVEEGLNRAVENIENFLAGRPTDVVILHRLLHLEIPEDLR